jgi:hypothetical protein
MSEPYEPWEDDHYETDYVEIPLILPTRPEVISAHDLSNFKTVDAPTIISDTCVQNIQVVLAGFTDITTQFKRDNRQAWQDINKTFWPYESLYPIDGYTMIVQLEL